MDTANDFRAFPNWIHHAIYNQGAEATRSHLSLDEEYWLALRHPAEVSAAGRTLLGQRNAGFGALSAADQEVSWREFRSYVRQAEGFYRGASVLPWKSSPLNYYYSFLNLAKAMAVARGTLPPQAGAQPRRLRHGLSASVIVGPPQVWRLTTQGPDDVFPRLYDMAIGTPIANGTELDARELLKYISPIAWQLDKSGYGPRAWYACYWVLVGTDAECWDVLVVPRDANLAALPPAFDAAYREIVGNAVKGFAKRVLDLHAVQANAFRFLERKVPIAARQPVAWDHGAIERALKNAAPYCAFEHLASTEYHLCIGLPCPATPVSIPMNEFIAAYAIMYFLSSLVRYHPDYMDAIGESSDAWLIESFAKSAPLHLLRYLAASVLGYTLIIESA